MEINVIRTAIETQEIGMEDKVSGENSGRQAQRQRCKTTEMDTAADDLWDGNR